MKRLLCLLLIGVVLPFLLHADTGVLDAIRRGDTSALKSALASSVDPNTKDDTGATALMYAAAYASAPMCGCWSRLAPKSMPRTYSVPPP